MGCKGEIASQRLMKMDSVRESPTVSLGDGREVSLSPNNDWLTHSARNMYAPPGWQSNSGVSMNRVSLTALQVGKDIQRNSLEAKYVYYPGLNLNWRLIASSICWFFSSSCIEHLTAAQSTN